MALRSLVVSLILASPVGANADMWCAHPLWVHEWGVHVLGPGPALPLPGWFHHAGPDATRPLAVRELPPDSGVRALPVLQFYVDGAPGRPIPIGLEVGFHGGPASAWYPQVDALVAAAQANGPGAIAAKVELDVLRAMRQQYQRRNELVPPDPTKQLVWDRLTLTADAPRAPSPSDVPWVNTARAMPGALWVAGAQEAERFVFYEADTHEANPLTVARADGWDPKHRAYVLKNGSDQAVHDVFVVTREAKSYLVHIDELVAHGTARFVLEDHVASARDAEAALRATLLEAPAKTPPAGCTMDRDPAVPVEHATSHRLYGPELDLLLSAWRERFFARPGTTIVYREDARTLDEAMPLAIYADMTTSVVLSRASLALWEGVVLP